MVTIKEIAKKAGVSVGTVDRVIHDRGKVSPKTKALILEIIEELNYQPNSAAQKLALLKRKIRFAFFSVDPVEHPFYEDVLAGAKKKASELAQYGVSVEFYFMALDKTIDLDEFQADGIAIIDIEMMRPIISFAHEHEIPIIYYNLPSGDSHSIAYVGCDYQRAGRIAAGLCALLSNKKGTVGILSDLSSDAASHSDRLAGFCKEIKKKYPEMHVIKEYGPENGNSLEVNAVRLLRVNPNIDLIYLINPKDYKVCSIIRAIGEEAGNTDIRIITNDLVASQRSMLEEGLISATICQSPEYQGAQTLELLYRYVVYNELPEKKENHTELTICIEQTI